ncbi:hypothetical protein [Shewanella algae]|uniref:hypothetical protein n=1 Tax=Shewanella algae TaxID=38313 RepID=UPI001AAD1363|nr:hypothetical protein [Shewanella algae]MBO2659712.1 hypothetical protein [Shewanella algae]
MSDPKIIAAVVSGSVTLSVLILKGLTKPFWEKHFHHFKIRTEHRYEQKKKIKEAISKYKVPLIDAAESLNHRLWNFSGNCSKDWLTFKPKEKIKDKYYLQSFCYRYLVFFAWCRKIEKELVYLDSTLSDKDDLYFVKYLKTMQNIFCDVSLFDGRNYDSEHAVDHFFKDQLLSMADSLITESGVVSFSEFQTWNISKYKKVSDYFSTISKNQDCNKWFALHGFHFVLMAFLSKYGYDYQKTSKCKLEQLRDNTPQNLVANNLFELVRKSHLDKCKNMKVTMKVLRA